MSFLLANPSTNKAELIAQIDRLIVVTSGNCTFNEDNDDPSLTVDEDFITSGRKPPGKLRVKVKINPTTVAFPANLNERTIEEVCKLMPEEDDLIAHAYSEKYNLTEPNTFVVVADNDSPVHFNPVVLKILANTALNSLNIQNMNLVIVRTGSGKKQEVSYTDFDNTKFTIRETPVLEWGLTVRLASMCRQHILMRSKMGTLCAKISPCKVFAPIPLIDNSEPTMGWCGVPIPLESTKYFDRLYYINLDHRTDRRSHMENQLKRFNLASARIVGVNGKSLEWNPSLGVLSKFWNNGALGYCLSYQNAIIDAIRNGYERVLIMDDDAVLTDNFLDVLEKAFQTLPADWHMLYLAANHSKDAMPTKADLISESVYRLKGSLGSHAIIINKVAFDTILNFASSPYGPLDLFFSVYQQICPCYITYPGVATQLPGRSDIINENVNYTEDWKIDYINHIQYLKNDNPAAVKE